MQRDDQSLGKRAMEEKQNRQMRRMARWLRQVEGRDQGGQATR